MKTLLELYRKYGVSQVTLRSLAAMAEKEGRASKGKHQGKTVWYMAESVVIEYLAGGRRDRGNDRGNKQDHAFEKELSSLPEIATAGGEELASLKRRLALLEFENRELRGRLSRVRRWARAWKRIARKTGGVPIEESDGRENAASPGREEKSELPQNWKPTYVTANGVRLHCVTQGQGPLLILLHDSLEFWYSWRHQIPVLAQYFTVVAPDMRGYNESDKPKGMRNYRLDVLAEEISDLISALGEKRATVVGRGWGGAVALRFAMSYPKTIERVAAFNSPPPDLSQSFFWFLRNFYVILFQIPWLPEMFILRDVYAFTRQMFLHSAMRKDAFTRQDIKLFCDAMRRPGAITSALNYYRAAFWYYPTLKKSLTTISCPALLIWSRNNPALREPPYDIQRYFTGPLEIRYIPACGAMVEQEQPESCNHYLLEFLNVGPCKRDNG